jgi:hypothetical protein
MPSRRGVAGEKGEPILLFPLDAVASVFCPSCMEGTGLYATPTSAIVRYPPPDILVAAIAVYLIIVYNKELFLWTIASFSFVSWRLKDQVQNGLL